MHLYSTCDIDAYLREKGPLESRDVKNDTKNWKS